MEVLKRRAAEGPTAFVHQSNITVSEDGRTVTVSQPEGNTNLRANAVQCRRAPLSAYRRFFSISIDAIDSVQYVMMGLTRYCWPRCPEWDVPHSVRYHSNDGGIFNGGVNYRSHHTYTKGDKVTCRVSYFGRSRCLVDFMKNETYAYRMWVFLPATELYPTVGFAKTTATLTVDWPLTPARDIVIDVKRLTNWLGQSLVERSADSDVVKVTKPITTDSKGLSIVAPKPFDRNFNYFDVDVLELTDADDRCVAIGVAPPVFSNSQLPGWLSHSVGYHSDDGGLHKDGKRVAQDDANKCKQGDVMGCGVVFSDARSADDRDLEAVVVTVYFTKNGSLVYQQTVRQHKGGFFPCVAFMNHNNSVKINTEAKCTISTQELRRALDALNVAQDLIHSDNMRVTGSKDWQCSVEATSVSSGFVQLTSWNMEEELQCFAVTPENIPQTLGKSCKILVGMADKVTSSKDDLTWRCSYSMTSGQISHDGGMNLTSVHEMTDGGVTCRLDYSHKDRVVVQFYTLRKLLGRGTFKRDAAQAPVCATVALTGTGAKLQVDWTGVLFPPRYRDKKDAPLSEWLAGDEELLTPVPDKPECMGGKTTSMQSPSHFTMSLPYVNLSIGAGSSQLPAVGVASAWSDLQCLIGGRAEEVSYDLATGEVISNNEIVHHVDQAPGSTVRSVGVGVIFTQQDVRAPQNVVVYFTINNLPWHQLVFTTATGGVYPTITFPPTGCQMTVTKNIYPQLPDTMRTAWRENMASLKQNQNQNQSAAGAFSSLTGKFSASLHQEEDRKRKEEEDRKRKEEEDRKRKEEEDRKRKEEEERKRKEEEERKRKEEEDRKRKEEEDRKRKEEEERKRKEEEDRKRKEEEDRKRKEEEERKRKEEEDRKRKEEDRLKSEKIKHVLLGEGGKGVQQGKITFTADRKATFVETNEKRETITTIIGALDKPQIELPKEQKLASPESLPNKNSSKSTGRLNTQSLADNEVEITKTEDVSASKSENTEDAQAQKDDADTLKMDADPKAVTPEASPNKSQTSESTKSQHSEGSNQESHTVSNTGALTTGQQASPTSLTHTGQQQEQQQQQQSDSTTSPSQQPTQPETDAVKVQPADKCPGTDREWYDLSHLDSPPNDTSPPPSSLTTAPTSSTPQSSSEQRQVVSGAQSPESRDQGTEKDALHVLESVETLPPTNLLLDPEDVYHDRLQRNSKHINSLSISDAKQVLEAINKDDPEMLSSYLSTALRHPARASRTRGGGRPSSQPSLQRQQTSSKACVLS